MTTIIEIKFAFCAAAMAFCFAAVAERQPIDRYQSIIDRQMFGQPPPNFDPTVPPSMVQKGSSEEKELTREQEAIKSSIHFSAINVTPDGSVAVGFTDNSDSKTPIHYYLKVGESRNGWKVLEADPVKAKMRIAKDDVEVALDLGANSAKGGGSTSRGGRASNASGANMRPGLLGSRRIGAGGDSSSGLGGSLRERRALREQARQEELAKERELEAKRRAEAEAKEEEREKEREAQRQAEREEQRRELQSLKDELKAQREAAERARAEREAARQDENAEDEN